MDSVVDVLLACLDDRGLPLLQWSELFAVAQSRLPDGLAHQLEGITGAATQVVSVKRHGPVVEVRFLYDTRASGIVTCRGFEKGPEH